MPLLLLLTFAANVAAAPTVVAYPPGRVDGAAALRQVAAHACWTSLPEGVTAEEVDTCIAGFSWQGVVGDDGACARYGVVEERLVFCQGAVADWACAEAAGDARAALVALIRVGARCAARELCPRGELKAASFRRPSPTHGHRR